jgi:serine-type D-Ala-D-Ala endopeptidase (penicillin-binding protein 7)
MKNLRHTFALVACAISIVTLGLTGSDPAMASSKTSTAKKASHANKSSKLDRSGTRGVEKSVVRPSKRSASLRVSTSRAARSRVSQRLVPASSIVQASLPRSSYGQLYGLHTTDDQLKLQSSVAFVIDQDTQEVLFSKNAQAVLPIASLTKLMTAMVVVEAQLPYDQLLSVSEEDIDTEKGSRSRLHVGAQLTRLEMLHLALMSSENRAANTLGRSYPGGIASFVMSMNRRARELGMQDTRFVEPTGLSSSNQSSARDLALLVNAAYRHPLIRELSTSPEYQVALENRHVQFRNTNMLVRNPSWEIGLQKTGYIVEAGRCLVMQAKLAGRKLIMVFLDSNGRHSRLADAERIRRWVNQGGSSHQSSQSPLTEPSLGPGWSINSMNNMENSTAIKSQL